jgi:hypothetical protein
LAGAAFVGLGVAGLLVFPSGGQAAVPAVSSPQLSPTPWQATPSPSPSAESLESEVKRHFLADQEGLARALGGDKLGGGDVATGQGLFKLIQIMSTNQAHHLVVAEEVQTTSLAVSTGTDAKFPPNAIVVEERGYKRDVTKSSDSGAVQSVQMLQIDNRYWMQRGVVGRYVIADWDLSEQPVAGIPSPAPSSSSTPSIAASESPAAESASPGPAIIGGTGVGTSPTSARAGIDGRISWGLLAAGLVIVGMGVAGALVSRTASFPVEGTDVGARTVPFPQDPEPEAEPDRRVVIRTMGEFAVTHGGVDHAPALRRRPLQAFLWLYLLVLALEGERRQPTRHAVAEEVYPGLHASTQDERMRSLLRQRKTTLPAAIADLVRDDGKTLAFDLDSSVVDAHQLLVAAEACKTDPELRSDDLKVGVAQTLDKVHGRFLDFWEELAGQATGGHGETEALVAGLRSRLDLARTDLLLTQGRNALWRREPGAAVEPLKIARALRPERDDTAAALIEAYEAAGRQADAELVRRGGDL